MRKVIVMFLLLVFAQSLSHGLIISCDKCRSSETIVKCYDKKGMEIRKMTMSRLASELSSRKIVRYEMKCNHCKNKTMARGK
jgi:arginine repressor